MQLASISPAAVPHAAVAAPSFTGGIDFSGSGGRFTKFAAHATDVVYGKPEGYTDLQTAINELTMETVGPRRPAAGVFEHEGRFYGRKLDNTLTFANGANWKGNWKLEQFPADLELLQADFKHGTTTRSEALRAIVDGAQRVSVTHLPVTA